MYQPKSKNLVSLGTAENRPPARLLATAVAADGGGLLQGAGRRPRRHRRRAQEGLPPPSHEVPSRQEPYAAGRHPLQAGLRGLRRPYTSLPSSSITVGKPHLLDLLAPLSQVLSDPQKRAIYDQYGEEGLKAGAPPPAASTHGAGAGVHRFRFNTRSAEEIFSEIFGGGFAGAGPRTPGGGVPSGFPMFGGAAGAGEASSAAAQRKAPPIERPLACTLEDLYKGATKKMKISRDVLDATG